MNDFNKINEDLKNTNTEYYTIIRQERKIVEKTCTQSSSQHKQENVGNKTRRRNRTTN